MADVALKALLGSWESQAIVVGVGRSWCQRPWVGEVKPPPPAVPRSEKDSFQLLKFGSFPCRAQQLSLLLGYKHRDVRQLQVQNWRVVTHCFQNTKLNSPLSLSLKNKCVYSYFQARV